MTDEEIAARRKEIAERNTKRFKDAEARRRRPRLVYSAPGYSDWPSAVTFEIPEEGRDTDDNVALLKMAAVIATYANRRR